MINEERAGGAPPPRPRTTRNGLTAAGNPTRRIGVLLTTAEWSILFEALRRFAMQNEAAGRPDRARLTQRVLSKLTIYRLAAGVDAVEDEEEQS